jgi:hypothetical protein
MENLLAELMADVPVKRQVNVEGWPRPVWIWKLDTAGLLKITTLPHETTEQIVAYSLALCELCVGDELGPGMFASDTGRAWLSRQGSAVLELSQAVQEFLELSGPGADRKKKSETPTSSDAASNCANSSESRILDDCLSG